MSRVDDRRARTLRGLRTNAFAAVVLILLEFGLGIGVNLYATLPATDAGTGLVAAFAHAVTDGPVVLGAHAVLGTFLLITGLSAFVRAALTRQPLFLGSTGIALLALVIAWLSGARFVGAATNGASLAMALATGMAILCYALILFLADPSAT